MLWLVYIIIIYRALFKMRQTRANAAHGDHPMKEEEKKPHHPRGAEYMLSQESIKQFEQAVEQETAEEREKLQSIER